MKPQDFEDQELQLPSIRDLIKNLIFASRYPLSLRIPGARSKTIEELLWIMKLTDDEVEKEIEKAKHHGRKYKN